jgi:hypothetical protein
MNREDVIRMADEAKLLAVMEMFQDELERFAALVAAHEREACVKVCEAGINAEQYPTLTEIATAIRKRGEK